MFLFLFFLEANCTLVFSSNPYIFFYKITKNKIKAKEIKMKEVIDGGTDRGLLFKPYYTFTGGSSGKTNYSVIHVLCTFTFINFSEK